MTPSISLKALASILTLCLVSCSGSAETSAPPAAGPAATPVQSVDAELEELKSVTPLAGCDLLTPELVAAVAPKVPFQVKQKLDPQMSGYAWDSRCMYHGGVGTMDFAKDTPTHVVGIAVNTVASPAKAQARLASRAETAVSGLNYKAQPSLGPSAYTISSTGYVTAFFVKGQAEIQLDLSDILQSTYDQKLERLLALAQRIQKP